MSNDPYGLNDLMNPTKGMLMEIPRNAIIIAPIETVGGSHPMYREMLEAAFMYAFDQAGDTGLTDIIIYVNDYVKSHSNDRRYTVKFRAATTSGRSAIIEYRGHKYDVYMNNGKATVEGINR